MCPGSARPRRRRTELSSRRRCANAGIAIEYPTGGAPGWRGEAVLARTGWLIRACMRPARRRAEQRFRRRWGPIVLARPVRERRGDALPRSRIRNGSPGPHAGQPWPRHAIASRHRGGPLRGRRTRGRILGYDAYACLHSGMRFPRQPARSPSRSRHASRVAASNPLVRGRGPHVDTHYRRLST